ncbi:hypothetical protein [Caballeronia sordidicola]|uniref:hypothetical protein n=1 Tax=Caballeronia sordidicola TaxID=196367 RepID=UPI0012FE754D|nr:hypothetical protein [Caballeronia sordidicola]
MFNRPVTTGRMLGALFVCTMLAACGDHDSPSSSAQSAAAVSPSQQTETPAPASAGSSDIQNWALQQTQPSAAVSIIAPPKESPASPASDPLLPPVIHEAE